MMIERQHEGSRNVFDWVKNTIKGTPDSVVSKYDYTTDNVGRRTFVSNAGTAFGCIGDHHWDFAYNDRNELTTANRTTGTNQGGGNGTVNATDIAKIREKLSLPIDETTCVYDVNLSGAITISDMALVKLNMDNAIP